MQLMLVCVALAAPAPVQDRIVPPKGPPPSWATAVIKDGLLEITESVMVPQLREEIRQRIVTVGGKQVTIAEKVAVTQLVPIQRTMRIMKASYYDTAGKEIEAGRAAKLLNRPTVVLMSGDGKALDPYYLRTIKEGTLIVVRPMQPGPGGPTPVPLPAPTDSTGNRPLIDIPPPATPK